MEARGEGYPSVYVVVPAQVSALDWLANDERRAQETADVLALEAEWLLAGHAEIGGGESGNPDPVQAVADALERFAADEIVVVAPEVDGELLDELAALGPPVTAPGAVELAPTRRSRRRATWRGFTSGRSERDAVGRLRRREHRAAPLLRRLRGPRHGDRLDRGRARLVT